MASTPSPYVTLISNDGYEFIVSRDAACIAGTIKKMLDPQSQSNTPLALQKPIQALNSALIEGILTKSV